MAKKNRNNQGRRNIPENEITYRGPITTAMASQNVDTIVADLWQGQNALSSAASTITNAFSLDPSSATDWSSFASAWHEYRILALELEFFPANRYSKTTTVTRPGYGVIDHADATALVGAPLGFSSFRILSLEDPWTSRHDYVGSKCPPLTWRMMSMEESDFRPTATPSGTYGSIKLFFDNLTASTVYGVFVLHYVVQFRGRA